MKKKVLYKIWSDQYDIMLTMHWTVMIKGSGNWLGGEVNEPAKLVNVEHVKIERDINGKRVTLYDGVPTGQHFMLHLAPLPAQVTSVELSYRAIDSGVTGLWRTLTPMSVSREEKSLNFYDSDEVAIGRYHYRARAFRGNEPVDLNPITENGMGADGWVYGTFTVSRGQGVIVPKPDLTKDSIKPKETAIWNRWKIASYIDRRGAKFDFKWDNEDRLIEKKDPEVEVILDEPMITNVKKPEEYTAIPLNKQILLQPQLKLYLHVQRSSKDKLRLELLDINPMAFVSYRLRLNWEINGESFSWQETWQPKRFIKNPFLGKSTRNNILMQHWWEFESHNELREEVQWTLEGLVDGVWHTILKKQAPTEYICINRSEKNVVNKTILEKTPTPKVLFFKVAGFQPVHRLRYHRLDRITETPVKRDGEYYKAALPAHLNFTKCEALLKTDQLKAIPSNLKTKTSPKTRSYYNATGQVLSKQRPNGGHWITVNDSSDKILMEYTPTYRKTFNVLNIFGDIEAVRDSWDNLTKYTLDNGGNRTETIHPYGAKEICAYNMQGQKLIFLDANNNPHYTQPGLDGRIIAIRDADRILIVRAYQDHTDELLGEFFANGRANLFHRDFWGRLLGGADCGGVAFTIEYNLAGGRTVEFSIIDPNGGNRDHGVDERGNLLPGKLIFFSQHVDGQEYQCYDDNSKALIQRQMEIGGKESRRLVTTKKGTVQDMQTLFDILGRIITQIDIDFTLWISYDVNSNKRNLIIDCRHPETQAALTMKEQVFTFNAEDRIVFARAHRENGNLQWNEDTSYTYYDRGLQIGSNFYLYDKKYYVTENYGYEHGRLINAIRSDGGSTYWELDLANRVQKEMIFEPDYITNKYRRFEYSAAGRTHKVTEVGRNEEHITTQNKPGNWSPDGTLISSHQEGHQKGQQYRSDLEFNHVFFDKPYEQEVINTVKIEDHASTTGVGTTYRGSNAELISFCSSAEFKEDKQFISDMNGQVYENRTGSADNTQDSTQGNTPERYLRLYPSSEGNIIAQFERDANRDDLPSEGAWKFIAEMQNTQKQNTRFIASPGMTLQILSGGNQEKLWALTSANPGYLPTDDLGGQQVIIPYAYTGLQLNASNHGFQTSSNYIQGPSVPSAPAPLAPEPGRVGGFKRFVPAIAMLAVCIVAQRYLAAAAQTAGLIAATTAATALTTQQAIGLMAITAVSVAAGNVAGQLTAKEMYPELYDGFDWNSVGDSAILGALMAGTQSALWNGMGVSAANSTSTIEKMAYAMTQAATTYVTNYAFQKVNGQGSFDLRGLMGTMVSAGLTRGLLTEFGFNEKEYDSLLKLFTADVVSVIGGGLVRCIVCSGI